MGISSPGIGSNLDVNSIVTQLMSIESQPLTRMQTQEASFQAKLSAFGQVKSAFSTFQSAVSSLSTIQKFQATNATPSDASVLSATATSAAASGNYAIEVSKLAQAQKLVASGQASTTTPIGAGTLSFDFGTITGTHDATGTYPTGTTFASSGRTSTVTISPANNSLAGIRDAINSAAIGVTATIVNDGSAQPNRLVLTNSATGAANSMKISVDANADPGLKALLSQDPAGAQSLTETMSAQNAQFTVDGLPVTTSSNKASDVIAGVTLNLTKTNVGAPTTLSVSRDTASVVASVTKFVSAYNAINKTLTDASAYDPATKTAAILNGDSSIRGAQAQLRAVLGTAVAGGYGAFSRLSDIGVSYQKDGSLALDETKLNKALSSNFNDVAGVFASAGRATDSLVTYATSSANTKAGSYALNVSRLATQSSVTGANPPPSPPSFSPNTGDQLDVTLNGATGTIKLNPSYADASALAADVQSKINSNSAFSGATVRIGLVAGKIAITSDNYGSASTFSLTGNAASAVFGGTASTVAGQDVAGSINGTAATGHGTILTAATGDASEGLQVAVTGGTTGARGTINFSKGYAAQFNNLVDNFLGSSGSFTARSDGLTASIADLKKREATESTRLTDREAALRKQYTALDTKMSALTSTSSYLTQQLAQIASLSVK